MVIWRFVEDWNDIPEGCLIAVAENRIEHKPSSYWYRESNVKTIKTFFVKYNPNIGGSGEFTYKFQEKYYENKSPMNEGMASELLRYFHPDQKFLYGIEAEPYDPNQEPEDDCL